MSTTTYFVCDACKSFVWAGQNTRIYGYKGIPEWLHLHLGHDIKFMTEHMMEDGYYDTMTEWKYSDEMVDKE